MTKFDAVSTAFSVTLPPAGAANFMLPAIIYPQVEPLKTSTDPVVVLNLICPVAGLAGRCAVVPDGKNNPPVAESAYDNTPFAACTFTDTFDAVSTGLTSTVPSEKALSRNPIMPTLHF
jgi:hypothetical protein